MTDYYYYYYSSYPYYYYYSSYYYTYYDYCYYYPNEDYCQTTGGDGSECESQIYENTGNSVTMSPSSRFELHLLGVDLFSLLHWSWLSLLVLSLHHRNLARLCSHGVWRHWRWWRKRQPLSPQPSGLEQWTGFHWRDWRLQLQLRQWTIYDLPRATELRPARLYYILPLSARDFPPNFPKHFPISE